jgi:hypothetical protein
MPAPASESDNYKLLFAIVDQMEVKNINWVKVANSLGIEKVNTVQKRWSVLKKNTGLGMKGQGGSQNGSGSLTTPNASPVKSSNQARSKSLKRGNEQVERGEEGGVEVVDLTKTAKKVKVEKEGTMEVKNEWIENRGYEEDDYEA